MKHLLSALILTLISFQAHAGIDPNSLECGATINGELVKFHYNPIGGKFDYSGATQNGLVLIYVKYNDILENIPSKIDRVELTVFELLSNKQYSALSKLGEDGDLKNYRKARIYQNTVALYDGFVLFEVTQGTNKMSISCRKPEGSQKAVPQVPTVIQPQRCPPELDPSILFEPKPKELDV